MLIGASSTSEKHGSSSYVAQTFIELASSSSILKRGQQTSAATAASASKEVKDASSADIAATATVAGSEVTGSVESEPGGAAGSRGRKRSILRKDSSYEDALRPILKNNSEAEAKLLSPSPPPTAPAADSSTDDSVDAGGAFSDVIIDKPSAMNMMEAAAAAQHHHHQQPEEGDCTDSSEAELEKIFEKVHGGGNNRMERVGGGGGGACLAAAELSSSSDVDTSNRMINSAFNDVIIDPVPAGASSAFNVAAASRKNSGVMTAPQGE